MIPLLAPDAIKEEPPKITESQAKAVLGEALAQIKNIIDQSKKPHLSAESLAMAVGAIAINGGDESRLQPSLSQEKTTSPLGPSFRLATMINLENNSRRGLGKKALKTGGAIALTTVAAGSLVAAVSYESTVEQLRMTKIQTGKFDEAKIFPTDTVSPIPATQEPKPTTTSISSGSEDHNLPENQLPKSTNTPFLTETATSTPTASPIPEPGKIPEVEIGTRNFAEFLLGGLIDKFIKKREHKYQNDPAFRERISPEFLRDRRINMVYLGVDETRKRPDAWNDMGMGRADIVMLISFDPVNFQFICSSFSRDLSVQEMLKYKAKDSSSPGLESTRINEVLSLPLVTPNPNPFEMTKKIIETATGIPIDGVVETNIDFMEGYSDENGHYHPGIFDRIFPNGLDINIANEIVDHDYPDGYRKIKIVFKPGTQNMRGERLTQYSRTRHGDSDTARTERQKQVLMAAVVDLFPHLVSEFAQGNNSTLDKITRELTDLGEEKNLFFDINVIEILKGVSDGLLQVKNHPKALQILSALAANSVPTIANIVRNRDRAFINIGINRQSGAARNMKPEEPGYVPFALVVNGSQMDQPISPNGNAMEYWNPIRTRFKKLFDWAKTL